MTEGFQNRRGIRSVREPHAVANDHLCLPPPGQDGGVNAAPGPPPCRPGVLALVLHVLGANAIGLVGALTTATGDSAWYQALAKPAFQPPSWVFGPVWTLLYTLMGVAAWRVSRAPAPPRIVRTALVVYALQLVLNGAWTPVFFGAQAPRAGLVILLLLVAAVVATLVTFRRADRLAGWLLVPYLLWVVFAAVLNASIVALGA